MTQLRFVPATFAASAIFLFSSLSSAIVAPSPGCGDGPTCAMGFECTVVGVSGCAASAPCAAGQSCPPAEPCITTTEMGCTPAHCSGDAECAPGMLCHAWQEPCAVTDCACGDAPDCGCGVCNATTVSLCTPRYMLPCEVAADCGDGFTCEEEMTGCAVTGSSGGPTPGGLPAPSGTAGTGATPAPAADPPVCAPMPTGQFQCVPKEINCESLAECPAGWSCDSTTTPTSAPCAPGADCAARPIKPAPTAVCRPPYYGGDSRSGGDLGLPVPTTGQGSGGGTSSGTGTGTGTSTGSAGKSESAPSGGPGASGGSAPGTSNKADDASSHESSACQLGHAPASSGVLSVLTLLGALLGLKRRRARA